MNDYFAQVWPPSAEHEPEQEPEPRLSDRTLRRILGAAVLSTFFSVIMIILTWPIPWPPRVQDVILGCALSLLYWSLVFWWLLGAEAE